ncbi:MAG: Uma2 family endonuclease [Haliscomenobacter sp.]|uniref:Uma2 family endonuclease n=1 Tax=Haliscomenobacter sp. TaxID=2717303 RepID=UPI0029ACAA66|nr:Uma2 family endonuclease [Haliscomenobacter sp.]MDX2067585.1 Uma2 family endonuclease [Haliscomenobacter sp.]
MPTVLESQDVVANVFKVKFHLEKPLRMDAKDMSSEEFFAFCQLNDDLRIERAADGQMIIMAPTGSETGNRNSEINAEIVFWNRIHKLGVTFDSSTGFTLPNGAERAPDTAWIRKERWDALGIQEKKKFAPIAPDFVLELRSENQSLSELREKMDEYMDCGCRLGWLIDPQNRRTYVYNENGEIQTVSFEEKLSGGEVMPGLEVVWGEVI